MIEISFGSTFLVGFFAGLWACIRRTSPNGKNLNAEIEPILRNARRSKYSILLPSVIVKKLFRIQDCPQQVLITLAAAFHRAISQCLANLCLFRLVRVPNQGTKENPVGDLIIRDG